MLNRALTRAHEHCAMHVLLPLYELQRLVIPSRRPQMRAFREGLRFRRASTSWPKDRRREWMLKRLRFSLRRASETVPYYRDLFARVGFDPYEDFGFDDFAYLPVLEREDVRAAGRSMVSSVVPPAQVRKDATGGSTGTPTVLWLGPEERGWREGASEYFMQMIGAPKGARRGLLWGHHLDPVARDRLSERLRDFTGNQEWFDCFRLSPEILEQYHERMQRSRPHCVVAYASALGALAERVKELGDVPQYPTCCFVTGAEKLSSQHREVLEEVYGRPVHERYGSRDVGLIGFQLDPQRTLDFAIDWANVLVEPEAEGDASSILITKLHADAMPMLRYRVGDLGRFPEDSRPGQPTFLLEEVIGRETDRVWLPDGHSIHGIAFPHLMKDYPVNEFQIIQSEDFSVVLNLVPGEGFTEATAGRITETLRANLPGVALSIQLVDRVERTAANKLRPVITAASGRVAGEVRNDALGRGREVSGAAGIPTG